MPGSRFFTAGAGLLICIQAVIQEIAAFFRSPDIQRTVVVDDYRRTVAVMGIGAGIGIEVCAAVGAGNRVRLALLGDAHRTAAHHFTRESDGGAAGVKSGIGLGRNHEKCRA